MICVQSLAFINVWVKSPGMSVSQTAVSEPAASKLITSQPEISEHAVLQPATIIVKAWFTNEEIDKIIQALPKARNLTGRESEVFVEILEGKKQKEIACDLGIEITTVKEMFGAYRSKSMIKRDIPYHIPYLW